MRRLAVVMLALVMGAAVVAVVAAPAVLLGQFRTAVAPLPADIPAARVDFRTADGVDIAAWSAEAEAPKATVILVHGAGGNRSDAYSGIPGMMRDLLGRNYSVLALDLRHHGDSADGPRPPSFGPDEALDVRAAVDWVEARHPGRRIAAIGISMGGNAVLYAALADPRIEALVTQDTYAVAAPVVARGVTLATGLPDPLVAAVLWSAREFWGFDLDGARVVDAVAGLGARPWLILQAANDPLVPLADAEALAAADPAARLLPLPAPDPADPLLVDGDARGSHGRSYRFFREPWVEQVTDFLDATFATLFG